MQSEPEEPRRTCRAELGKEEEEEEQQQEEQEEQEQEQEEGEKDEFWYLTKFEVFIELMYLQFSL